MELYSPFKSGMSLYFICVFLLESFFLYYVTVFCAVYRYSQKYWFIGCLESFAMDSFVALIICIFLALFRYISIISHIKCFYIVANIINTFLWAIYYIEVILLGNELLIILYMEVYIDNILLEVLKY